MKSIFITSTVFILLCTAMVLNYNYINEAAKELTALTNSLDLSDKEECEKTVLEIKEKWERSTDIFSLSVSFREIDYLGEVLISLSHYCNVGNEGEFERYRQLLLDAIEGVSRLERFSIINIL